MCKLHLRFCKYCLQFESPILEACSQEQRKIWDVNHPLTYGSVNVIDPVTCRSCFSTTNDSRAALMWEALGCWRAGEDHVRIVGDGSVITTDSLMYFARVVLGMKYVLSCRASFADYEGEQIQLSGDGVLDTVIPIDLYNELKGRYLMGLQNGNVKRRTDSLLRAFEALTVGGK